MTSILILRPVISLFLLLTAVGSASAKGDEPQTSGRVWAVMKPIQCLSNAWEKDWMSRNKNRVEKYPYREERKVLREFFSRQGIEILDVRHLAGQPTCTSCECERGDTLFLLIDAKHAEKMESYGFKKRLPELSKP
jgi:hypothetical protein